MCVGGERVLSITSLILTSVWTSQKLLKVSFDFGLESGQHPPPTCWQRGIFNVSRYVTVSLYSVNRTTALVYELFSSEFSSLEK